MGISFVEKWLKRNDGPQHAVAVPETMAGDQEGITALLAECDLLRDQAAWAGVELDDSADSLAGLDQLMPRWRTDPGRLTWLGNDAGLYLGTVIVRTVQGAAWHVTEDGRAVIRLESGRELDVVETGHTWAEDGSPELAQFHAEAAEGSG